jgi:hypothetical protein
VAFGLLYSGLFSLFVWAKRSGVEGLFLPAGLAAVFVTVLTFLWCFYDRRPVRRTINTALWVPMLLGVTSFLMTL